jgi:uncharacterized protein (DUF2252 family)
VEDGPLQMGMKVRSMSESAYKFWRGSKDLFYAWSREHCADWWADREGWIVQQGDLHFGNVGSYVVDPATGKLAVGMVDFDDSATAPVGLEVVQGLVSLRLAAGGAGLELTAGQWEEVEERFSGSYRRAFAAGRNAGELLRGDAWAAKLVKDEGAAYAKVLSKYVEGGKFRRVLGGEKPKEYLVERKEGDRGIAAALERMFANCPAARGMMREHDAAGIEGRIRDVAQRVRLGSSGSQGQRKLFVLIGGEAGATGHEMILYLKETIPSAAVRSGLVTEKRNPAQRLVENVAALTSPGAAYGGWTELDGHFYCVTVHEPWSRELDEGDVRSVEDLLHGAAFLGTAAGASHQGEAARRVKGRLTAGLMHDARFRAAAFAAKVQTDFAAFAADPRARALREAAERELAALRDRARR